MKLRNKKTGEIANLEDRGLLKSDNNNHIIVYPEGTLKYYAYNSLAELNEEWEDYEEPKGWSITMYGGISRITKDDEILISDLKEIGNYFNDKESAYEALVKLKAWKRLKDKGFKVIDYGDEDIRYEIKDRYDGCLFDLETVLFGGEE